MNAFVVPAKADFVNLQLNLKEGNFASYYAVLETMEEQQVWREKGFKSVKNKNEKAVTVTLPAQHLKKGDYIINVKRLTKEGIYEPVSDYSFTVNRR